MIFRQPGRLFGSTVLDFHTRLVGTQIFLFYFNVLNVFCFGEIGYQTSVENLNRSLK